MRKLRHKETILTPEEFGGGNEVTTERRASCSSSVNLKFAVLLRAE